MPATSKQATAREWRTIVLLVVFFVALTVLFGYPISTSPNTYLNELADVRLVTWAMAWNAHALATDPLHLFDANIFFPNRNTLAYSEPFLAPSLIVAPVNWAGYPVLAYNLVLLSSFVLGGLGGALWVRHLTGSLSAGVLAGIIWAFAPGKFDQLTHLHMMLGQWVPFALLFCTLWVETGRARYLHATVAVAALQYAFSMHYGVFLLPVLALYGLALLVLMPDAGARRSLGRSSRDVLVAGLIYAVLVLPLVLPFLGLNENMGLGRAYEETLRYSARPRSFFSGSPLNRAPHVVWLHDRYQAVEANYFPGLLALVLAAAALFGLLPATLAKAGRRFFAASRADRGPPAKALRRWVFGAGALTASIALALHVGGFVAGYARETMWSQPMVDLCRAVDPSLWLAGGATAALLALPPASLRGLPRWRVYLVVIGYMTLLTYLLAYGPEVRGFGQQLGRGPYWLLYRYLLPFQGIRAAGRIGLLWILFVAALAGCTVARIEHRIVTQARAARSAVSPRAVWRVVLLASVALLVWEFRVWPLPHEAADPSADPADGWLAERSGDFAVVHAPIESGPQAWRETRYMLGSTRHWKRLVNGYSGFFPPDYQELAQVAPLSREFFELLRSDFPVRYLLVHQDRLANDVQQARLRRLLSRNNDATLVEHLGFTFVFEVSRDRDAGSSVRRRYTAAQLRGVEGIQFRVRRPVTAGDGDAIALAGWGSDREIFEVSSSWAGARVPLLAGFVDALAGGAGAFEIRSHTLVPLGETGARIASGFTADIQDEGTGVGVDSRWMYQADGPGLQAHTLERFGTLITETREFPPTPAGAAALREHVASLSRGTVVALTINLASARPLTDALIEAVRLLGGAPPTGTTVSKMVVVGRRGASPGQALQHEHHKRALVEIEVPSPLLELVGISLY